MDEKDRFIYDKIVERRRNGGIGASELARETGIPKGTVQRHLKYLRNQAIIAQGRDDKWFDIPQENPEIPDDPDSGYMYAVFKDKLWEKAIRSIMNSRTPEAKAGAIASFNALADYAEQSGALIHAEMMRKWISDFERLSGLKSRP